MGICDYVWCCQVIVLAMQAVKATLAAPKCPCQCPSAVTSGDHGCNVHTSIKILGLVHTVIPSGHVCNGKKGSKAIIEFALS